MYVFAWLLSLMTFCCIATVRSEDPHTILQNLSLDEVVTRAKAIAAINFLLHLRIVNKHQDSAVFAAPGRPMKVVFGNINKEIDRSLAMLGASPSSPALNTWVEERRILNSEEPIANVPEVYQSFRHIMDLLDEYARVLNQPCFGEYTCMIESRVKSLDSYFDYEYPVVMSSALIMIYKKLGLNDEELPPGRLLSHRVQMIGKKDFLQGDERAFDHYAQYYPMLFKKNSQDVTSILWRAINDAADGSLKASLIPLCQLETMMRDYKPSKFFTGIK
ncbi:uncharacterized protein BBOV_IV006500 [Babesia bovis T2Bo]|uniref:Uncharacterized protein n=1 Tax=Babesia bovis TaxID=5865 RepID=A7AR40_BABBO|nr:uncharacterized protein BBOV_IV006500 [Babesia bovis T2Bo]EDO07009.1 hypothetical protein BBOV_IV006500 [Babesia bovis T2Bo]|eukprot:XP_001610577.1 hypothetical protein [Babesia bovis T2Bo]